MRPPSAVVASFSIAPCRSNLADRSQHGHTLLGVAEKHIVLNVETMIDPQLNTVRIVYRGSILNKVLSWFARNGIVGRRCVLLKKLLHWSVDQRLREFVARRTQVLIL